MISVPHLYTDQAANLMVAAMKVIDAPSDATKQALVNLIWALDRELLGPGFNRDGDDDDDWDDEDDDDDDDDDPDGDNDWDDPDPDPDPAPSPSPASDAVTILDCPAPSAGV